MRLPLNFASGMLLAVCCILSAADAQPRQSGISLVEAVQWTLKLSPTIQIQDFSAEGDYGTYRTARGQFDVVTNASVNGGRTRSPLGKSDAASAGTGRQTNDTLNYGLGVSKQFRSGPTVALQPSLAGTEDNILQREGLGNSSVTFSLNAPLLRGFGETATAGQEIAARHQYQSSLYTARNTVASTIQDVVTAYWNYAAAVEDLEIQKFSENRAQLMLDATQKLIKADSLPASEIDQATANLTDRSAQRIRAEFNLHSARQQLGVVIGLPSDEIEVLAAPSDKLPVPGVVTLPALKDAQSYKDIALRLRSDIKAIHESVKAADVLARQAKNAQLPQLDAGLSVGYNGLSEGHGLNDFSSFADNVRGTTVLGSLTYSFPVQNNTAIGVYIRQQALLKQLNVQRYNLERTIASDTHLTLLAMRNAAATYNAALEAVQRYQKAYENELKKFKLGSSTLLNVDRVEVLLAEQVEQALRAQNNFAASLIAFRFTTGTLLRDSRQEYEATVTFADLVSTPNPEHFPEH